MKEVVGQLDAKGLKIDLIVARFNELISNKLLDGALDYLRRHGAKDNNLTVYRVPGSYEIPMLAQRLARRRPAPDAIICIGAVIRGGTDHYQYVASSLSTATAARPKRCEEC